jgi:hypothetical protein
LAPDDDRIKKDQGGIVCMDEPVTAIGISIVLVEYGRKRDGMVNTPANSSISITLDEGLALRHRFCSQR